MNAKKIITAIAFTAAAIFLVGIITILMQLNNKVQINNPSDNHLKFNANRAMQDIEYQMSLGPRYTGSNGHSATQQWLKESLEYSGWQVIFQTGIYLDIPVTNVIAKRGSGPPQVLLGAHYDTRIYADKDPLFENRKNPVVGANDGASGVSVLLEIARIIPEDFPVNVWLVFFDAEDNGDIPGWEWIIGSQFFVQELREYPEAMVLVDMVGDKELNIYIEKNSDPALSAAIWGRAANLGYEKFFIPKERYAILDDHIPFIQAGIPAVNIIDFDYPYHHTTHDTLDKVSARSIQIVGDTLLSWLESLSN